MTPARLVAGVGKGTFEDDLGARGLEKRWKRAWRWRIAAAAALLASALLLDEVVLGGGNAKRLKRLPPGCRLGDNALAFEGGFRLWDPATEGGSRAPRRRALDQGGLPRDGGPPVVHEGTSFRD